MYHFERLSIITLSSKSSDMSNILDPMDLKQIISHHLDGFSKLKIGVTLGVSHNTANNNMWQV